MTETLKEPIKEQVIKIEPDDEIATIRDRITWAEAPRVLLVVSRRNKAMRDKMAAVKGEDCANILLGTHRQRTQLT